MKTYLNLLKTTTILTSLAGVLLLSSCLKDKVAPYNPPIALVSFFQAAPNVPAADLYFDSNRANWGPINYGTGVDYFRVYADAKRNVNLYVPTTFDKVFSDTITFKRNTTYSLFLADNGSKDEYVLLTDTINQPASGETSIRFIDLSPDAPAVDLAVKDSAAFITNKTYKGYSSFLPLGGDRTYTFNILEHGTSNVLATLSNVSLGSGYVYTVVFTGLAAATTPSNKLSAYLFTNAYFY
jgi:hypothetical protein